MPRGETCNIHPADVMRRKKPPCGRLDKHVEVEDHGVGYLLRGCSDLEQAVRILDEYCDPEDYQFFARVLVTDESGRLACGVWAGNSPSAVWYGSDGSLRVPETT
jgi:hypothetical protein